MISTSTQNCNFSNPLWIQKTGEVRTLEPLATAGTNTNFQFGSSTCQTSYVSISTTSVYNGFTAGEIITTLFLFWILVFLIFQFLIFRFSTKKSKI